MPQLQKGAYLIKKCVLVLLLDSVYNERTEHGSEFAQGGRANGCLPRLRQENADQKARTIDPASIIIINPYINQQQLQLEHFILEQILFCSFFLLLLFILSCIIVITHWGGDQFG